MYTSPPKIIKSIHWTIFLKKILHCGTRFSPWTCPTAEHPTHPGSAPHAPIYLFGMLPKFSTLGLPVHSGQNEGLILYPALFITLIFVLCPVSSVQCPVSRTKGCWLHCSLVSAHSKVELVISHKSRPESPWYCFCGGPHLSQDPACL